MAELPRLRQAVIAAGDLDAVANQLCSTLGLAEPYADPGVAQFGLRNVVFALHDSFLEVVSPIRADASAARLLERRSGDTGYMLMFQVDDLAAARARVRAAGVREVLDVSIDGMAEVHLHPADMRGAIVSLSRPRPPEAWRWGGPDWSARSAPARITAAVVAVADPDRVAARWATVLGAPPRDAGITFIGDPEDRGPVELHLAAPADGGERAPVLLGGVRFVSHHEEEKS
jgi:hypothetical protein